MNEIRNDIAFIKSDNSMIVLIEHQSATSHNMDIRLFLYYARILENHINKKYNRGLHTPQKIVVPDAEFYVLFNGKASMSEMDKYKTKLKIGGTEIDFNTKIININFDDLSLAVKDRKDSLSSYAMLIKYYYQYKKQLDLESPEMSSEVLTQTAFELAIKTCRDNGLYLPIFDREEFKVMSMRMLTIEELAEIRYEIGVEEGREEGREEEKIIIAKSMLELGAEITFVSKSTGLSIEVVESLYKNL